MYQLIPSIVEGGAVMLRSGSIVSRLSPALLREGVTDVVPKVVTSLNKNPGMVSLVVNQLRRWGIKSVDGFKSLTAWASGNKANAATFLILLASLGMDVKEYFSDSAQGDITRIMEGDVAVAMSNTYADAAAAASQMPTGAVPSSIAAVSDVREILSYAKAFFGSETQAIRAHLMLQAFFEMPATEVTFGFDNYKV